MDASQPIASQIYPKASVSGPLSLAIAASSGTGCAPTEPLSAAHWRTCGDASERRLHFLCGKMAAGKSTLSKQIAAREEAILLSQKTNCSTRCFLARWPTSVLSMSTRDGSRQRSPRTCVPCFPKECPSFSTSRPTRQSSAPGFGSCWTSRPGQPIPRARETTTRTSRALSASSFPDLASALDPRAPAAARRPPGRRA